MLKNLTGTEYAERLKEAIVSRRAGNISPKLDVELGNMCNSIAQWAISKAVTSGKLWRTFSQDPDFQGEIIMEVVEYCDKVDLSREPKEILVYLNRVARSAIRDQIHKANALKRQHEEVDMLGMVPTVDFYGQGTGAVVCEGGFDGESEAQRNLNRKLALYATEFKINI
jgi:hypothetical protein